MLKSQPLLTVHLWSSGTEPLLPTF